MSTPSDIQPNGTKPLAGDPDAIREDLERTREDLAQTVDALHAKLDLKSQAMARVARTREQLTSDDGKPRREVLAGVVGVLVLVAALVWLRRR
jgi:hypothetical protein